MNITTSYLESAMTQKILNPEQVFGIAKRVANEAGYTEFKTCQFYEAAYQSIQSTSADIESQLDSFCSITKQFLQLLPDQPKDFCVSIDNALITNKRLLSTNITKAITKLDQSFYSYLKTTILVGINEKVSAAVFRTVKSQIIDHDYRKMEQTIKHYAEFAKEIADIVNKSK